MSAFSNPGFADTFIQKIEELLHKSKHSLWLRKVDFGPKYRDMVFCPEFKKEYRKMVFVPNLMKSSLPKNLMERMDLEGIDGIDSFLRAIIHLPTLPNMQLRLV